MANCRKWVLAVLIEILLGASIARADVADNIVTKYAEAFAAAAACSELKVDTAQMALYVIALGLDPADFHEGGPLFDRIAAEMRTQQIALFGTSEEIICAVGRMYYGEDGISAPGLLVEE